MTYEQRYGDRPPDSAQDALARWQDRKAVWIKAQLNAAEQERARWVKVINRIAETSCNSVVQAALWGVAEMMERNVEHVNVQVNSVRATS